MIRAFSYLVLPLLLAGIAIIVDKRAKTRERRLETLTIFMFAFGAASGVTGALGYFFASDAVAEAIGWPAGSPFQLEMGFANLAMGVLAAIAVNRKDGFREATVIGSAVLSVGAFVVHVIDLVQHGNLAAGNTLINITNLGEPALLIYLLWALRKAEQSDGAESSSQGFARWQEAQAGMGGTIGAGVGIGLGTGTAVGQPLIGLVLGLAGGIALGLVMRARAIQQPASVQTPAKS